MKVGDRVRILLCNEDDNANKDYEGMVGVVVKKDYQHGCGEVDNDPLIHVRFDNGVVDGFWNEEVEAVRE